MSGEAVPESHLLEEANALIDRALALQDARRTTEAARLLDSAEGMMDEADQILDADGVRLDRETGELVETGDRAVAFFGRRRLAEIEPRDLRAYAAEIAKSGVARDTIRLALAPVKALLATASEDGLIRSNPAAGLRNLIPAKVPANGEAVEEEKVKALTEDELTALLDALPDQWRPFFDFLAETGQIGRA